MTVAKPESSDVLDDALENWTRRTVSAHTDNRFNAAAVTFLARMPPSIAQEFRLVFSEPAEKARARPRLWQPASVEIAARSLLDAALAASEGDLVPQSVADLVSDTALRAVEGKVRAKRWSGRNASRVLKAVRVVHYLVHGHCPRRLTRSIARYDKTPRRDTMRNVVAEELYIQAALAAEVDAEELRRSGLAARAKIRKRDALHFAIAMKVNWRLSENVSATIQLVSVGPGHASIRVVQTKTHSERIVVITDPRILRMIGEVMGGRTSGPLFIKATGDGLKKVGLKAALVRTGRRYMKLHTTHNTLRRAAASAEASLDAKRARLGQKEHSDVAETDYTKSVANEGIAHIRDKFRRFADRILKRPQHSIAA